MDDQAFPPTAQSPEIINLATRMYEAARSGDLSTLQQALLVRENTLYQDDVLMVQTGGASAKLA